MATTTHGLPYPIASDAPAGHTQMQSLAETIDTKLLGGGYDEVLTAQTRNNATAGDLTTAGPSITLTVPTNGFVQVFFAVGIQTSGIGITGYVDLAEDGSSLGDLLASTSQAGETRYPIPGSATGTASKWLAGQLVFPATAGSRTYKLTYRSDGTVTFSNRRLWVRYFTP